MGDWGTILVCLVAGVALLAKGATWLVGGSSVVARRFGVSAIVVGLTTVAWGTSAPEVVVSAVAAWRGQPELSLGNVLGSNVANIGIVLGASSLVLPLVCRDRMSGREMFWIAAPVAVLWGVCWDEAITRAEALVLIGVFLGHNVHLFLTVKRGPRTPPAEADENAGSSPWRDIVLGMVALALGAELTVRGATGIAEGFGISEHIIGLTVVAIGTSLPELVASLVAAFRGESEISLGNVVGSNVFNLTLALGVTALIHPFDPAVDSARLSVRSALDQDLYVVAGFTLAAIALPFLFAGRAGRLLGLIFLGAYAFYIAYLF